MQGDRPTRRRPIVQGVLSAVLVAVVVVGSLAGFLLLLRAAGRAGERPLATGPRGGGTDPAGSVFEGLDRLAVGVDLKYDDQTWHVLGVQRADDGGWAAWHLDDRGQSGWMLTRGREDEVVMAVRAERPETLDPVADAQDWRDHAWVRRERTTASVGVEGERRVPRGPLVAIPPADAERGVWTREELPSRRLVLERSAGQETWNAWIGSAVPGRVIDVWPLLPDSPSDGQPS